MAHCVQSAQDFITGVFPTMVGALASEDAEYICNKNDLSFVELIRPFCQLDAETQIHDPVNPSIVVPVKKLKIRVIDVQSSLPPPALVKRVLTEVVSRTVKTVNLDSQVTVESLVNSTTPWYEAYRDCFFQLTPPMSHEFFRDFLACILVVSTRHPDPMNAFAALSARQSSMQHSTERKSYRWFSNTTLKYYLLLHDVSEGENAKAEAVYQSMKSVYGSHTCFLLQINSRQKMYPNAADDKMNFSDPWSPHIYPFSDETLDVDETELERTAGTTASTTIPNQKDADQKEEAIVNELENIDKQLKENPNSPSLPFNDPLTSMHYDDVLGDTEDAALEPLSDIGNKTKDNTNLRLRKLSERSLKLQEYKKCMRQFSYHMVTSGTRKGRGQNMTLMDQDKIKAFIYEFVVRGLLPHMEKLMRSISEQIIARRGIHKSIFNATKKWFGGSKSNSTGLGTNFNTGVSYSMDSPEVQYRRLGDLAFLVQHYDLAYTSYHSAKREFNNDHAWLYFAGALEMAAVSAFLLGGNKAYPIHYFDAGISTYLNTCRLPELAVRACLMSTEALKYRSMFTEAALEFIKLTNGDTELCSALLLEQAAHCYLRSNPPMLRKYAFHMILAGHRYSKALQRKHTLRCYINALQIYQNKGWCFAEDHVNFIIGRQSFNLGHLNDAQRTLKALLSYESPQPPSQQASHLREFLAVFKQNLESSWNSSPSLGKTLPILELPKLECTLIKCLLHMPEQEQPVTPGTPMAPSMRRTRTVNAGAHTFQKHFSKTNIQKWSELEQKIVRFVTKSLPYPFKPYTPCLSNLTDNKSGAVIAAGEQFAYEIQCYNPLKIPLNLLGLTLLWEFQLDSSNDSKNTTVTNMEDEQVDYVWTDIVDNFHMKPSEQKPACLKAIAKVAGHFKVVGIKYTMSSIAVMKSLEEHNKVELNSFETVAITAVGVKGMQPICVQGPRLNSTKQQRATVSYASDKRMELKIIPSLPLLQVKMFNIPVTLLCGEVQTGSFQFTNTGSVPLKNLYIICSHAPCFLFGEHHTQDCFRENNSEIIPVLEDQENRNITKIPLKEGVLEPNCQLDLPVCIYGMDSSGVHEINFLFYYEPVNPVKEVPYRLLQQMIRIQTLSTLRVKTECRQSSSSSQLDSNGSRSPKRELLVSLTIENNAQGSLNLRCVEFTLKELRCYSTQWRIRSLMDLPEENFKLRPGETCSLHLKAAPVEDLINTQAFESNIALSESMQRDSCSIDLFMKSTDNVSAILNSIGIILFWETFYIDECFSRNVIQGQSHLTSQTSAPHTGTVVNANQVLPVTASLKESHGVTLSYEYNSVVKHDFTKTKLCMVPITLHCSNENKYEVELEYEAVDLYDDDRRDGDNEIYTKSSDIIHWAGHREGSFHIASNAATRVTIHGVFTSVGLYEIQNINVYIVSHNSSQGHIEKTALTLPKSHCISIES